MSPSPKRKNLRVIIIGAGPGGLCMAIRLKQAGFENFVLLEKGDGIGGTWRHNRYPGCACDIPSALYSFSFEVKKDWSRPYAPQPEILSYMEEIADKYALRPYVRLGCDVEGMTWDEDRSQWTVRLASGEVLEAEAVVSALGMFNELTYPAVEGLQSFSGKSFHSARWDWDHSLKGRRVAVIGSAASAVQFIPEIVKEAAHVSLFQRSANWILPKEDDPYTEEQLEHFRSHPTAAHDVRNEIYNQVDGGMTFSDPEALAELEIIGQAAIDRVKDPDTRKKLRPTHPWGCKRPLYSNVYYPCFNRENLDLITDPIERIEPGGVRTEDGELYQADTLIMATGFAANRYLSVLDVTGRNGLRLQDAWSEGARAYLGLTTSGFPNLFMLYGPNTNNGSILTMIEYQVDYVLQKVQLLADQDFSWLDVRSEPMERFNETLQEDIAGITVWSEACNGYYRSESGRVVTQWPYSMSDFEAQAQAPDSDRYEYGGGRLGSNSSND